MERDYPHSSDFLGDSVRKRVIKCYIARSPRVFLHPLGCGSMLDNSRSTSNEECHQESFLIAQISVIFELMRSDSINRLTFARSDAQNLKLETELAEDILCAITIKRHMRALGHRGLFMINCH
jgi:hypothetical protein